MAKLSWKTEKRLVKDLMISEINPWQDFTGQKAILESTGQEFDSL